MSTPRTPLDYTNLDFESLRDAMLEYARETVPEWTDHSAGDLGVLLVELVAHACDVTQYYQTRIASNLLPATSDEPEALVQLLRLIGYELRAPAPASVNLTIAFRATESMPVVIPARTPFDVRLADGESIRFETESEVTVQAADLSAHPSDASLRVYDRPLAVVQGESVIDDALGVADGTANQRYTLTRAPVLRDPIQVVVEEPGGSVHWQQVEALAHSAGTERHFIVQRDAAGRATVVFGDGANGMVPPRGAVSSPTAIRATYRVGGGTRGNVPAGTEFRPHGSVIKEARNQGSAAAGGSNAEPLSTAKRFAPRLFRTQQRAVTATDFADLARQVAGVGKVLAVPAAWNEIVLYVAPQGVVGEPTELLQRDLYEFFESRRMATVRPVIMGPRAADLYLRATIYAQPYFLRRDVEAAVQGAIADHFAFDAIDFGQVVFLSRLYDTLQDLEHVASLNITQFSRDPAGGIAEGGLIRLAPRELPRLGYRDNPDTPPDPARPTHRPPIVLDVVGGVEAP